MELLEAFKALSDITRIRIFNLLIREKLCVCELERILGITQSNASRHLNKLRSSGLIDYEKMAQWVYYKVDDKFIADNKLLLDYIGFKSQEYPGLQKDLEELQSYRNKNIRCEDL